jgi:hypothetical protein
MLAGQRLRATSFWDRISRRAEYHASRSGVTIALVEREQVPATQNRKELK